jgi:hypothetical protein
VAEEVLDDLVDAHGPPVVDLRQDLVLELERTLDLLGQDLLVEEVLHADAETVHFVGVGRADAATGGADLATAQEPLGDLVHRAVVVRDDVGVRTQHQAAGVDAALVERVDLLEQHREIDDDTVADHRDAARTQDAAGQQVQRVRLAVDDHRVAGVVAAVELDDVVDAAPEEIGCLALALVTPLGPDDDDCRHGTHHLAQKTSPGGRGSYRRSLACAGP